MTGKYVKYLFTNDYRMRWAPIPRPVIRGSGIQPYPFDTKTFVDDYSHALEWFAAHNYDGILAWAMLRDVHGGVDSVRKLSRLARELGIRWVAGVGINCYGGIYYDGDNPFCINDWARKHPELVAIKADGSRWDVNAGDRSILCGSKPENLQWHLDGLTWLLNELPDLGGVTYETGDYGMCHCDECKKRAGQLLAYSFGDVSTVQPTLMAHVHKLRPDLVQIGTSYTNIPYYLSLNTDIVEKNVPDYAYYAWVMEGGVGHASNERDPQRSVLRERIPGTRPVTGKDIAFLAYNSHSCYDDDIITAERNRLASLLCHENGLKGVILKGELSDPANLINYITMDFFLENRGASLYDGLEYALAKLRSETR
jgi:hypothetical protein